MPLSSPLRSPVLRVAFCVVLLAGFIGAAVRPAPAPAAISTYSPVGTVLAYGGSTLPSGWLWADGMAYERAAQQDLYNAIGDVFNTSSGGGLTATQFRVPCMMDCTAKSPNGRMAIGPTSGYSGRFALGETGGAVDHRHSYDHTHDLNTQGSPERLWTTSNGAHSHTFTPRASQEAYSYASGGTLGALHGNLTTPMEGNHTHFFDHYHTTQSTPIVAGGAPIAGAANPPFLTVRYIIKSDKAALDPCGGIWGNGGASAPVGALDADGSLVTQAGESNLYGCLGGTFNTGGETGGVNFRLPCLQSCAIAPATRIPMGKTSSGTGSTVGGLSGSGGTRNHAHTLAAHSHTINPNAANQQTSGQTGFADDHTHQASSPNPTFLASGSLNPSTGTVWSHNTRPTSAAIVANGEPSANTHVMPQHDHGGTTGASSATSTSDTADATAEVPYRGGRYMVYSAAGYAPKVGTIASYGGSVAPLGWVFADGTPLSKTTYAKLYAVVGETYSAPAHVGGANFSLDLGGRLLMGTGTGVARGAKVGQLDHVHTAPSHTHSVTPEALYTGWTSHYHTVDVDVLTVPGIARFDGAQGTWNPTYSPFTSWYTDAGGALCPSDPDGIPCDMSKSDTQGHAHFFTANSTHGGATSTASTTTTGANNPPYLALNYIVKAYDDPVAPTMVGEGVTADAASDIDSTPTTGALSITWNAGTDAGQGIQGYNWCVSLAQSCDTPYRSGTTTGAGLTVSATGTTFPTNVTYFSCVATRDLGGNVGPYTCSDGVYIEYTPPDQTSPVGTILAYAGTTEPTGWKWADGTAVSRTGFADLFAAAGTAFGAGDGSTTFNLPCLMLCSAAPSGRFPVGTSSFVGDPPLNLTFTRGSLGGAIDHTHTLAHTHVAAASSQTTSSNGAHTHTGIAPPETAAVATTGGWGGWTGNATAASAGAHTHPINHSHTFGSATPSTTAASSGNPPYLAVNYIVKTTTAAADPCGGIWGVATGTAGANAVYADGTSYTPAAQPALAACVGNTFGGTLPTNFNVPCLQSCVSGPSGRIPLGKAASGQGPLIAASGGQTGHSHTLAAHTHSISSEAPNTDPENGTNPNHTHSVTASSVAGYGQAGTPMDVWANNTRTTSAPLDGGDGDPLIHTTQSHNHGGATGSSSEVTGTADVPSRTLSYVLRTSSTYTPPVGTIVPYAGASAPPGWLLANSTAYNRTEYPMLSGIVGSAFGTSDATVFRVDMTGRFPLGKPASGTGAGLGTDVAGSLEHSHTAGAHTHTIASDTITVDFRRHYHTLTYSSIAGGTAAFKGVPGSTPTPNYHAWYRDTSCDSIHGSSCDVTVTATATHNHTLASHNHGGATSGNARVIGNTGVDATTTSKATPPYLATNFIVKAWDAPSAPATVGEGAVASPDVDSTTSTGALTLTWTAGSDGGRGIGGYDWCVNTAPSCGSPLRSGSTTGTGVTVSATGTAFTAGPTTYYSCVRTKDTAIMPSTDFSPYRCSDGILVQRAPNTPTLVSPPAGAASPDTTPDLQATFSDPDGGTGLVRFQVCTDSGCSSVVRTGVSGSVSNGTAGTWTVSPALSNGTYYWRAQNEDSYQATSAYSTPTRQVLVGSPSLSINVDNATRSFPALTFGVDSFVDTTLTVTTNSASGYSVNATDESDTWGADSVSDTIPDWTAPGSDPAPWDAGVSGYWGFTVRDATNARLSKWGVGTGVAQSNMTDNYYVGLDLTTPTLVHRRDTFTGSAETIVTTHRINPSANETAGSYTASVIFTVTANP